MELGGVSDGPNRSRSRRRPRPRKALFSHDLFQTVDCDCRRRSTPRTDHNHPANPSFEDEDDDEDDYDPLQSYPPSS